MSGPLTLSLDAAGNFLLKSSEAPAPLHYVQLQRLYVPYSQGAGKSAGRQLGATALTACQYTCRQAESGAYYACLRRQYAYRQVESWVGMVY